MFEACVFCLLLKLPLLMMTVLLLQIISLYVSFRKQIQSQTITDAVLNLLDCSQ